MTLPNAVAGAFLMAPTVRPANSDQPRAAGKRVTGTSSQQVAKTIARRNHLGLAAWNIGNVDAAIDHFRRAIALDPDHTQSHVNLAQVLLVKGDIQAGFEHLERMWPPEQGPVWEGRSLHGETVLLHRDPRQGFGDVIQFARYAPMVVARSCPSTWCRSCG